MTLAALALWATLAAGPVEGVVVYIGAYDLYTLYNALPPELDPTGLQTVGTIQDVTLPIPRLVFTGIADIPWG